MRAWYAFPVLLLLAGCGGPSGADESASNGTSPAPNASDTARVLEQGGAVATTVAQGLAQRLQGELSRAGAVGAVEFCSHTALALTDSLVRESDALAVKRTSWRIRNPRNAPDQYEREALAWFDSTRSATGVLPVGHVQDAGEELRFYRPLMIAPFCTPCHGPSGQLDPGVRRSLAERYPDDQATGYAEGDMRGVIRVSLPRTAPPQ